MAVIPTQLLLLLLSSPIPCECPVLPKANGLPILEVRWQEASSRLASQWQNPNDVLTVLLIIGGDIVQKALAQMSGGHLVPVAFSFGWVSYSINTLLVAYGDGTLMPSTPYPSTIVNTHSGYPRLNYSWILNRLLRSVEASLDPLDAALCVSVYQCKSYNRQTPHDWLWWSGLITIAFQLVIAGIPLETQGDWSILLVTGIGTALALLGGSLPQWRFEKWGDRFDERGRTYCLTRGNGFQHVIVIQNKLERCLNLESLALPRRIGCSRSCKVMLLFLAVLWILFLINVCGLRQHTWYLLGVGFVGMIQNIFVAAIPRQPYAMGLPLELVERLHGHKVMRVLMDTEQQFPSVGASLVHIFFPGKLRDDELEFWSARSDLSTRPTKEMMAEVPQSVPVSFAPAQCSRKTSSWHTEKPVMQERRSSV